jgi:subtilisin family serine protease
MKRKRVFGLVTAALSTVLIAYGTERTAGQRSVSAEEALLATVKQHPLAKLGPWLINLSDEFRQFATSSPGQPPSAFKSRNPALNVQNGQVVIEGVMNDPVAFNRTLSEIGATDIHGGGILFSARVPVDSLRRLGADPALRSAAPVLAKTRALQVPVISQGVGSLFGLDGRDHPEIDGSGKRIGVLSDSFGCEPPPFDPGAPTSTVAEDKANDELPSDIVVAADGCPGGDDEGRAMLQITHDVAPGATGAFHTAFRGSFDFACGIMELGGINTPGAAGACGTFGVHYSPLTGGNISNVIVDDVIYFAEPMFMPGAIAQAADTVAQAGIPYFSSAGNQARASYEAPYKEILDNGNFGRNLNRGVAPGPNAMRVHDFGSGDTAQTISMIQAGGSSFVILSFQWDQPHFGSTAFGTLLNGGTIQDALKAPAAATDMDVLFYDDKGILVPACPPGVAVGLTCQITGTNNLATGDAVDLVGLFYTGPKPVGQFQIRIVRSGGSTDVHRVKYVPFQVTGATTIDEFDTRSGTAYGHANAQHVASVGAAAWYATVEWKDNPADPFGLFRNPNGSPRCNPACAEDFSGAGNIPIFFDGLGNRLAAPFVRQNPWVTGPDGGNTSFAFDDSSFDDDDGDGLNNPYSTFLTPSDPDPASEYPNFFGTSASAPHVAAVAALMLQKNPALTPASVYNILRDTAEDMRLRFTNRSTPAGPVADVYPIEDPDPAGFDYDTGWGFVNGETALNAVPASSSSTASTITSGPAKKR